MFKNSKVHYIMPNMEHNCLHTSKIYVIQEAYTNAMSPAMSLSSAVISLRFSMFLCSNTDTEIPRSLSFLSVTLGAISIMAWYAGYLGTLHVRNFSQFQNT